MNGQQKRYSDGYIPTPKQRVFHQSTAKEVLYGGAAGGGKSRAIVQDAYARCMAYPGTMAYLFRRTFKELEQTLIKEAQAVIPDEVSRYNSGHHLFAFANGSMMVFSYCDAEADVYKYQGVEIQWLYFDELTHFTQKQYDYLKTRLRAKRLLGVVPCVRASSNPGGVGHAWVKKYFVDDCRDLLIKRDRVYSDTAKAWYSTTKQYIPARVTDNPHIDPNYALELENKPPALRDALLNGNWDAFEGQVFSEFVKDEAHYYDRRHTHVIAPFPIPAWWPRYRGFDWGYTDPYATLWVAFDEENRAYVYRELYGRGRQVDTGVKQSAHEVARAIARCEQPERDEGIGVFGYADPSIYKVDGGISHGEEMGREGVYFQPADNSRIPGKLQIHERLRFNEDGVPMLYIFDSCPELIRTLPSLPYDERRVEDVDTRAEDHLYDALRYVLMARPHGAEEPPPPTRTLFDPLDQLKRKRRGRYG